MTKIFSNLQDNTIHHFILSQEILNKDINYSPGKKKKKEEKINDLRKIKLKDQWPPKEQKVVNEMPSKERQRNMVT